MSRKELEKWKGDGYQETAAEGPACTEAGPLGPCQKQGGLEACSPPPTLPGRYRVSV